MQKDIDLMIENYSKVEVMLKLLANKNRLMIFFHLIKEKKSVGQLSELVGLSSSVLSQHLAKMKR